MKHRARSWHHPATPARPESPHDVVVLSTTRGSYCYRPSFSHPAAAGLWGNPMPRHTPLSSLKPTSLPSRRHLNVFRIAAKTISTA
nr:hypothetical protein CFP56_01387 [Quercus suber]